MGGKNNKQFNWSRTARDVIVTAINKGQLPVLGVCSVFMVILIRIPENDLSEILRDVVIKLSDGEMLAYVLLAIQSMAWFGHAKMMRKNHTDEMNRVSKEKSELQNLLSNSKFKTSDK